MTTGRYEALAALTTLALLAFTPGLPFAPGRAPLALLALFTRLALAALLGTPVLVTA